jgi:site-specific DNA-methyltransferase (adenine-specific)
LPTTKPYYQDDLVTLYHGDCREVTTWLDADVLVTDPPYPNNAGHFDDAVHIARDVVADWPREALVFWNECEFPPYGAPPVAVHIWHRPNVNGRPYEPAFHFAPDGRKRRSLVLTHSFIHSGVGPGSAEYVGHPTQKPAAIMGALVRMTEGVVADPFAGSGSTLLAAKNEGRRAVGVEVDERYCEAIANRLAQDTLFGATA